MADVPILEYGERQDDAALLTQRLRWLHFEDKMHDRNELRISIWEHEHVLKAVLERLDADRQAMRRRLETVEHPFGTLKMRTGTTHFLMKLLPKVATEMALHVLAYNLTRVMNVLGVRPLVAAMMA